jgi:DNA repair exonuclease SbcCD ATPase subunit
MSGCVRVASRNTCLEVGQALLQRHEAYVRRHPKTDDDRTRLENEIDELRSQNASLEKVKPDYMLCSLTPPTSTNLKFSPQRLARALVNSEVSEASNKVVLQELQDTRSNLSRITTQHTKCVGLESRLARVTMEKEDIQQERDSASQRARVAEARTVSLRNRVSRLQEQLTTLHTELDQHRNHRLELSEEISQGARSQLEAWLQSKASFTCFFIIRSASGSEPY